MFAASALAPAVAPPPASAQTALTDLRPLDEVCAAVRRRFYDREYNGKDWERLCAKARERARECADADALHRLINKTLGGLGVSHTVLIDGDVYRTNFEPEFAGRPSIRPGFELGCFQIDRLEDGWFVTAVYDGGPAERAALAVGDRVVAVNHIPVEICRRLADAGSDPGRPGVRHAFLRADEGESLVLDVQAVAHGGTRRVFIRPGPVSLVEDVRSGARIVERDGCRLAVLHAWHFMHWNVVRAMRDALEGPLADADGLVLDLRGRGGQVHVLWGALALFTPRADGTRPWNKPAVALIDGSARSAKEIFAWHWKRMGLGPLVGRPTAGAVLGSTFLKISDGSILQLAVADVTRLTGGESLEGRGVEPDVTVDWEIPYCNGRDAILEKGLETLGKQIGEKADGIRY